MAPPLVAESPFISSRPSSRIASRTPQVKAPCEPPPCSARFTILVWLLVAAAWPFPLAVPVVRAMDLPFPCAGMIRRKDLPCAGHIDICEGCAKGAAYSRTGDRSKVRMKFGRSGLSVAASWFTIQAASHEGERHHDQDPNRHLQRGCN